MNFEKMMCDRLGYKYQDIFNHLGFTLNKMNMFLNTYGCGFNDDELEKINDLIFNSLNLIIICTSGEVKLCRWI